MKKVNFLISRWEGELASGGIWMEWYIDTGAPGGAPKHQSWKRKIQVAFLKLCFLSSSAHTHWVKQKRSIKTSCEFWTKYDNSQFPFGQNLGCAKTETLQSMSTFFKASVGRTCVGG